MEVKYNSERKAFVVYLRAKEIASFDITIWGDVVAGKQADAYVQGFRDGQEHESRFLEKRSKRFSVAR